MIGQETIQKILQVSVLREVIEDFIPLTKYGSDYFGECPMCGKKGKGKGLSVSEKKNVYKCFSCDFGGNSGVSFLMNAQKMEYPAALKYLAEKYNIVIEEETKGPQVKGGKKKFTYRDLQLKASGLGDADQKATVVMDDNTRKIIDVFEPGTLDQYGCISRGDDMVIRYIDLYGKPIMFQKKGSKKPQELYRIRWENPEAHRDKNGKPIKYQSPYGSGSHLFIPQEVRNAFNEGRQFGRLFIQEGEKKALKATKHGMFSVGIMGIQNLGQDGKLPYEIQLIVKTCGIKEVIFVLDSDWDHLSNEIKPGGRVDLRPYSFYNAVRSYGEYLRTFTNLGIYLEIYFAYLLDGRDKGIDDLLSNKLKGKELELRDDIVMAVSEKDGDGKYIKLVKISTLPDLKLKEYWNLHSVHAFAEKYKDRLRELAEFKFGQHKWKFNEKEELVPAHPLLDDEQYWKKEMWTTKDGRERLNISFQYLYAYNFLQRRGFGRIEMANRQFLFCQIKDRVVNIKESHQIRDFCVSFTKEIAPKEDMVDLMNMLYRGAKMYFGPDSLSHLDYMYPVFEASDKNLQHLFFKDSFWKITSDGIDEKPYSELQNYVWSDKINNHEVKWISNDFIQVDKIDGDFISKYGRNNNLDGLEGQFDVLLSEKAAGCHFIQFLLNTSDFYWFKHLNGNRKNKGEDERSVMEKFETNFHFVSKMTAIGYLLHKFRDKSCEKAIVAMDGRNSEVGESNGRTGKSLTFLALKYVIPQVYISGKNRDISEDPFIWEEVDEKIDHIFIDDIRANFDFEFLFPIITGMMTINRKGERKYTLAEKDTPKIGITTNHSINGFGGSFRDRQFLIAFSDYYDDDYKPIDDFGVNFFGEWDFDQWNMFYNFMAHCLMLYFKAQKLGWGVSGSGLIEAPIQRLEQRKKRQFIGENFMHWADNYFGVTDTDDGIELDSANEHIGNKCERIALFSGFMEQCPSEKKYVTPQRFKRKFKEWCEYRSLAFNPYSPDKKAGSISGGDDKSGGTEYFTVIKKN